MLTRAPAFRAMTALTALWAGACHAPPPAAAPTAADDMDACCRVLVYTHEATIFRVDVMEVRVEVDRQAARRVAALRGSRPRDAALDAEIVAALFATRTGDMRMTFRMGMPLAQFLDNTESELRRLGAAELLTATEVDDLIAASRDRYGALEDAGIGVGDRLDHALRGDTVTTVFVNAAGVEVLRSVAVGRIHRVALLGSFFAEASTFRSGLLDLVFGRP